MEHSKSGQRFNSLNLKRTVHYHELWNGRNIFTLISDIRHVLKFLFTKLKKI